MNEYFYMQCTYASNLLCDGFGIAAFDTRAVRVVWFWTF